MVNVLYLTTVYRSTTGVVTKWTSKVLSRTSRDAVELDLKAALEACEKIRQTLQASLERYDGRATGSLSAGRPDCSRCWSLGASDQRRVAAPAPPRRP